MLSVGYKIFASILQRRLAPFYSAEVGDYQAGFKRREGHCRPAVHNETATGKEL